MDLLEQKQRIDDRKPYKTESGTVDRVFEIYEKSGKDESGYAPVIIKLTAEEKKKKTSIN